MDKFQWRPVLHTIAMGLCLIAGFSLTFTLIIWLLITFGFAIPRVIPDAAYDPLTALISLIISGLAFVSSRLANQSAKTIGKPNELYDSKKVCLSFPQQPLHTVNNLPTPTYSKFIPRHQVSRRVISGLQQRRPLIVIVGLAGNGKTSLAHEIATHCLQSHKSLPQFDAVIWVSDKDRSGMTNLNVVLDEIARTLDYPGFTQYSDKQKVYEIERLLRHHKVLLIIDNFETITDRALPSWLLHIPEPNKVLITSRKKQEAFKDCWLVELSGMTKNEAQKLIKQRLQVLNLQELVNDLTEFDPLIKITAGNPKAIELALGLVKNEGRSLQEVVNDLYAARGEIFDDLFARAWILLDKSGQQILMSMSLFPYDACREALSATSGIEDSKFDRATERLAELSLLDEQRHNLTTEPRYTLHPLVRAFTEKKISEQTIFKSKAQERWISWYLKLARSVGWSWQNLQRLDVLDDEKDTLLFAINWLAQQQRDVETLEMAKGIDLYYFVRGLWTNKLEVGRLRIAATARLGNALEECEALALHAQLLCIQKNVVAAEPYLLELKRFASVPDLPPDLHIKVQHAYAFYSIAMKEFDIAKQILEALLPCPEEASIYLKIPNLHWLAYCYYKLGSIDKAEKLFEEALLMARNSNHLRAVLFHQRYLAEIDLDKGRFDSAEARLKECIDKANTYQDRRHIAWAYRSYARYYHIRGDFSTASAALVKAIDLFERIGLPDDLTEARDALKQLNVTN